jgi:hypothetical protein
MELTSPNAELLNKYFSMKSVSEKTQKKYITTFKRFQFILRQYGMLPPTLASNVNPLMKIITEQIANDTLKPEYINQFLSVLKCVVSPNDSEIVKQQITNNNKIIKTKHLNNEPHLIMSSWVDVTGDTIGDTTSVGIDVNYHQLNSLLKDKSVSDIDYCLFYLLLTYGVRNQDLIICLNSQTTTENYINIKQTECVYVRNKHKSVKQFGRKTLTISNTRFVNCLKKLKYSEPNRPFLFMNKACKPVGGTQMSNYINTTFNRYLNTQTIFREKIIYKILSDHFISNNNIEQLNILANHSMRKPPHTR